MNFKYLKNAISRYGIWFYYKGEEVLWVFPWRRADGYRFVSLEFQAGFHRLADIDRCWLDYFKASSKDKSK